MSALLQVTEPLNEVSGRPILPDIVFLDSTQQLVTSLDAHSVVPLLGLLGSATLAGSLRIYPNIYLPEASADG